MMQFVMNIQDYLLIALFILPFPHLKGHIEADLAVEAAEEATNTMSSRVYATMLVAHTLDNNDPIQIVTMDSDPNGGDESGGEESGTGSANNGQISSATVASTTQTGLGSRDQNRFRTAGAVVHRSESDSNGKDEDVGDAQEFIFTSRVVPASVKQHTQQKPVAASTNLANDHFHGITTEASILLFLAALGLLAL